MDKEWPVVGKTNVSEYGGDNHTSALRLNVGRRFTSSTVKNHEWPDCSQSPITLSVISGIVSRNQSGHDAEALVTIMTVKVSSSMEM